MTDDDQFGRRLGTLLRDELSDVRSVPGLTGRLRSRARRRRLMVGTAAAALVAITGAVGLAVVPGSDGVRPGPELVDVAHVRTQVTDALARSTDYVVLARSDLGGNSRSDEWTDAATGRTREDVYVGGKKLSWSSTVTKDVDGGERWFFVDYGNRWWSKEHRTAAEQERQVLPDLFQDLPAADPESISKALVDGTLEIAGEEKIDGHDTLRLRLETTIPRYLPSGAATLGSDRGSIPTTMEIWVDAASNLPYRSVINWTSKLGERTRLTTYIWLERTPANLKLFDLVAPAGFADRTGGKIR